jgi:beta-lactamase class A
MGALERAREGIEEAIRRCPATVGLAVKHLESGETLAWRAEERFPAASVIKVPILVEALRQAEGRKLQLDEPIAVRPQDKVGGFGILKDLGSVDALSLLDLLTLMIIISDNSATNLCIDRIGMDAVNAAMASLGLKGTVLQRKMMDMPARERGLDNFTTPADAARLLELVVTNGVLSPEGSRRALEILARQQVNDRLPLLLPAGVQVAHKTGELPGIRHDVGIVWTTRSRVVVAALTKECQTPLGKGLVGGEASELIARIGRMVFDADEAA